MSHSTHAQHQSREHRVRRELQRLLASVLLFGLCFTGKQLFPAQSLNGTAFLRQILTTDVSFQDSFAALGSDLADGHGVAQSVGTWCISVFAPAEITLQSTANTEPQSTTDTQKNILQTLPYTLKQLAAALWHTLHHDAAG